MRVNILVKKEDLETVKQNETNKDIFLIKVSPTGQEPATHYFCTIPGDQEKIDKILNKQNLSIMEVGGPKEFLNKWGLKIIR